MTNMWPNSAIWLTNPFLVLFGAFSLAWMVKIENRLLRCDQHLELQVLSTHMPYFGEFFFPTSNRGYSYQNSSDWKPKRPKIVFLGAHSIFIYINTYFFIRNWLKKENSVFSPRPTVGDTFWKVCTAFSIEWRHLTN